jgi:hypothetical protein
MEHLFLMFLDHTQRRSTVGRTPLDEWLTRRRDLYLTTPDTHNRQISMPPVGLEPTISTGERLATAHLLKSWVRIPPGAWKFVCCECRVLSGRCLCNELITRPEESYRLWCVVVCDTETSRIGAPQIHYKFYAIKLKIYYTLYTIKLKIYYTLYTIILKIYYILYTIILIIYYILYTIILKIFTQRFKNSQHYS